MASMQGDNRKLREVFLDGWNLYEFLDETTIDTNGSEYKNKVREAMQHFELATTIVSEVGMFSSNEQIDEVPTDFLQFLLMPYFLGKLATKRSDQDRAEALRISEIYLKDFLQRCQDYELCEGPKDDKAVDKPTSGCLDTTKQLVASAMARNDKIAKFKRRKELEEQVKQMRAAIKSETADEELKRDFFLKFIQISIIDANDEMENIKLEKGILEMRTQRMAEFGTTRNDDMGLPPDFVVPPSNALRSVNDDASPSHGHGHSHGPHHHHHHQHNLIAPPKPKPMQPFIITRDATQKAVFGLGYPSLPVMTVDEFYKQRVREGIFPDEEKMARINQEKALAALQDPEVAEEAEKEALEQQIENDDPEYLARMRRMDEYKDVVRRGDGNRYNRS